MASRANNPYAEVSASLWLSVAALVDGRTDVAESTAKAMLAAAERSHYHLYIGRSLAANGSICMNQGQWDQARKLMQRGFIVSSSEPRLLAYSAIIEFLTGNFAEGRAYLARLADLIRASLLGPTLECGYFLVAAALARRATDVPEFTAISREIEKAILAAPSATTALLYLARTGLSLFATQDLDTAGARSLYEDFNGERGENLSVVFTIPALHVRGLLAGTMGRPDLAVGHFEDAIAFCEKAGYLPDLAWTYCDYADLLLQRDGPGDHAKAAGLLDLALKISTELGMRPLMERVIARRDILKA